MIKIHMRVVFQIFCLLTIFNFNVACFATHTNDTQKQSPVESSSIEPQQINLDLPIRSLKIAGLDLKVELACTDAQKQQGLMNRSQLGKDQGMFFVFEREQILSFWMKNTLIPLSIAYISAEGKIIDIQDMKPLDQTPHPSKEVAQYALEVNQGWFQEHQIKVDSLIQLDNFCLHS